MKNCDISGRKSSITFLLFCCGVFLSVKSPTVLGQDKEESSRRETEVIKKIKANGGKIMQISSADSSREASFYLAGKKITDAHLKDLGAVRDVVWLNLANTAVSNDGLEKIAGLKLKKLHLEKTGIGDAGLVHLKEMVDLEYLNLYATAVTDEGLKHLTGLKKLKKVYVWQSKVTEAGMRELEKQIPGLKVVGESKLPVFEEPKVSKEDQLKAREDAIAKKEQELKKKEKSLNEKVEAIKKKVQELDALTGEDKGKK